MGCYSFGGIYRDEKSGKSFFSLIVDEKGLPICKLDWKPFFSTFREFAHVYSIDYSCKVAKLVCASGAAECVGILAPRRAKLVPADVQKMVTSMQQVFLES